MYPQQPIPAPARRRGLKTILAVAIPAALVLTAGAAFLVVRQTSGPGSVSLPGGVSVAGKDPGLAACEAMRDNMTRVAAGSTGAPRPVDEILKDFDVKAFTEGLKDARAQFAASRYPAIRDNGVKFVDHLLRPQSEKMNDTPEQALSVTAGYFEAFNGLLAGCRAQGIEVPSLEEMVQRAG
jgi:hypothetical protein